jgi:hypothetical protein
MLYSGAQGTMTQRISTGIERIFISPDRGSARSPKDRDMLHAQVTGAHPI